MTDDAGISVEPITGGQEGSHFALLRQLENDLDQQARRYQRLRSGGSLLKFAFVVIGFIGVGFWLGDEPNAATVFGGLAALFGVLAVGNVSLREAIDSRISELEECLIRSGHKVQWTEKRKLTDVPNVKLSSKA